MKYFAYGSNMALDQMKLRCPDSSLIGPAQLKNHRLDFTRFSSGWNCGVADVIDDPSQSVWGLLFSISKRDLIALDRYEGYPTCYSRKMVSVFCNEELHEDTIVYYVVSKSSFQKPNKEYIDIILNTSYKYTFPDIYCNYLKDMIKKDE